MNMIIKAAAFAHEAHKGQTRKYNGRPYIEHPARVAGRACLLRGVPEQVVAAAWLHDVVEDCGILHGEIGGEFGPVVQSLVCDLTNPSKGSRAPRAERKAMDRDHIASASLWARKLKAIDRIDNLLDMTGCDKPDFLRLYADESDSLAEALSSSHDGDDELGQLILEMLRAIDGIAPRVAAVKAGEGE